MEKIFIFLFLQILISNVSTEQILQKTEETWIPKIVWTWWEKKIQVKDHNLKMYHINHQLFSKGWQLRHLDETNQQYWFEQIPDYNKVLHSQQFKNTNLAHKSDLVRLLLVKHFGGLYIDYTMLLTQPLDWLVDIEKQDLVRNKFGKKPQVVLLHNTNHGSFQQTKTQKDDNGKPLIFKPTIESFFVAAKPKATFVQLWYQKFVWARFQSYKIWQNEYKKSVITDIVKQNKIQTKGYDSPYFQQTICGLIILQMKQQQFDKEWEKDKTKQRQFAVKYYKIWTIPTRNTAYAIHQTVDYYNDLTIQKFFKYDMNEMVRQNKYPRYFIKFMAINKNSITSFWINFTDIKTKKCPIQNYILENSTAYQLLLKNYPVKFYSNPVVNKKQDMDCKKIAQDNYASQIMILQNYEIKMLEEQNKLTLQGLLQKISNVQKQNKYLQDTVLLNIYKLNFYKYFLKLSLKYFKSENTSFFEAKESQRNKRYSAMDIQVTGLTLKLKMFNIDLSKCRILSLSKIWKDIGGIRLQIVLDASIKQDNPSN